jgi:hypothetical protein
MLRPEAQDFPNAFWTRAPASERNTRGVLAWAVSCPILLFRLGIRSLLSRFMTACLPFAQHHFWGFSVPAWGNRASEAQPLAVEARLADFSPSLPRRALSVYPPTSSLTRIRSEKKNSSATRGVNDSNDKYHGKPKPIPPEERPRIRREIYEDCLGHS